MPKVRGLTGKQKVHCKSEALAEKVQRYAVRKRDPKKESEMRTYLKKAREKMNYSQLEVAKMIGISPNYYSYIENGERQTDMKTSLLIKLSSVLKIPISQMLEREKEYQNKLN